MAQTRGDDPPMPDDTLAPTTPYLGATQACIDAAEAALGVVFPDALKRMWLLFNRVELARGAWRVFPVFDRREPRKTAIDIVYQNTQGRRLMPPHVLGIAESMSGSGNRLIVPLVQGVAQESVAVHHYRSGVISPWRGSLADFVQEAQRSMEHVTHLATRGRGSSRPQRR